MKITVIVFVLALLVTFPILSLIYHYNSVRGTQSILFSLCELEHEYMHLNSKNESSFLKVHLELQNEEDRDEITNLMPRIKHHLVTCILDLKKRDMVVGSEDVYRVRKDALVKINKIVHPVLVQNVFFNKFSRS